MKLIQQQIPCSLQGGMVRFSWRGGAYQGEVKDWWQETGAWWRGEKKKTFYLIQSRNETFELYHEEGCWWLYKIYD